MTYPPQGQPGDPYGQPQPYSQPPADGYAPGQVGPGYSAQPPQYTQPDAGQGGYPPPQPGYAPQPGQPDAYGQYGPPMPPPVPPTSKGGAGTAVLIVVVVILMLGGGVAGYLLLGGEDEGTTTASDESSESVEESPSGDGEPSEGGDGGDDGEGDGGDEPTAPVGDALLVESLGAVTPAPGDPWEYLMGPGVTGSLSEDSSAHYIQHTGNWISYMEVGLASTLYAPYDPADLRGSALAALEVWTHGDAFASTEGFAVSDPVVADVEVDGRPAVTAQATVSWTSSTSTEDAYEDVTVVLVDVDGANGFIGLASVPESGADAKQAAVDALLATTFGSETA